MGRILRNRRESPVTIVNGWTLPSATRDDVEGNTVTPSRTKFTDEQVLEIEDCPHTLALFSKKAKVLEWGEEVPDEEPTQATPVEPPPADPGPGDRKPQAPAPAPKK